MKFLTKIKIGAGGEQLPAEATDHVAVLLPQVGLMFTRRPVNEKAKPERELGEACTACNVGGLSGWYHPSIDEMQLVIDRTRHSPALDPEFFSDIPLDWLLSSTPAAWSSASAWFVDASDGYVGLNPRSYLGFALAVRRAGQ